MGPRLLALALAGCQSGEPPVDEEEARLRALLELPDHFEAPSVPEWNPLTAEGIELGRHLFYDRRLSANEEQACADCHHQERAFSDAEVTPTGSTGDVLRRNSPGLANVAWLSTLTWSHDGLVFLEDQLLVPLTSDNPVELGITDGVREEVMARLDTDPSYQALFAAAFPGSESGANVDKVSYALSSFVRSLVSSSSPYDRYLQGDTSALTDEQVEGFALFNGEKFECFHCHGGTHLTQSYRDRRVEQYAFFNTGLYNVGGDGDYPPHDQGLYELTLDEDTRGFFRPPSLRNVELTAPYMHDGSIASLREVLETYAAGGRNVTEGPWAGDGRVNPLKSGLVRAFDATDQELRAVEAFLLSLTDEAFLTDPRFSNPYE